MISKVGKKGHVTQLYNQYRAEGGRINIGEREDNVSSSFPPLPRSVFRGFAARIALDPIRATELGEDGEDETAHGLSYLLAYIKLPTVPYFPV